MSKKSKFQIAFIIANLFSWLNVHSQPIQELVLAIEGVDSEVKLVSESVSYTFTDSTIVYCVMWDSYDGCKKKKEYAWQDIEYIQIKEVQNSHVDINGNKTIKSQKSVVITFNKSLYDLSIIGLPIRKDADGELVKRYTRGLVKISKLRGGDPKIIDSSILD